MNKPVLLPSYKSSRRLIEGLFGSPKLLPVPEFKDNRPKYISVRKKSSPLEPEIAFIPTTPVVPERHKSDSRERRLEREFMAKGQFTPEQWLAVKKGAR